MSPANDSIVAVNKDSGQDRLAERIRHFYKRANLLRTVYMALKSIQLLCVGSIPVIAVAIKGDLQRPLSAALAASAIIVESLLQAFQFQRYWIQSRGTELKLQYEKNVHSTGAGPYKSLAQDEANALLAERVENILLKDDFENWKATTKSLGKESPKISK